MSGTLLVLAALGSVLFAYAWGLAIGYAAGRTKARLLCRYEEHLHRKLDA